MRHGLDLALRSEPIVATLSSEIAQVRYAGRGGAFSGRRVAELIRRGKLVAQVGTRALCDHPADGVVSSTARVGSPSSCSSSVDGPPSIDLFQSHADEAELGFIQGEADESLELKVDQGCCPDDLIAANSVQLTTGRG